MFLFCKSTGRSRRKLILLFTLFLSWGQGCLILNELDLNPGHETGDSARDRIVTAALAIDLAASTSLYLTPQVSVLSLMSGELVRIEDKSYYKISEVDACIGKIQGLGGALFSGGIGALECNLKPDSLIYDP